MSNSLLPQTAAEWTQQKKTQRKYLLQQIVALQTYLGYVQKGYNIARKGISTVQNIKNGEWNLHKDFFGSLSIVNPSIRKYTKVADIIAMQVRVSKQVKSLIQESRHRGLLSREEIDYVVKICDHLLAECLKNMDDLTVIITSGELEMKDDERIHRIETIYSNMQDKSVFLLSFGSSVSMLSKQRLHEMFEIELFKELNGLKQ
ncbi:MAG: hypothetical protein EOP48_10895 [Sphingobacteriales bacterium]|nr:MAG: hypothetical protein EOP48_10895 [Sphingobacteriales bacterium]